MRGNPLPHRRAAAGYTQHDGQVQTTRQVAAPGGSAAMPCGDGRGCFYADVCGACGAGSSAHMPRMCFVRSDGVYGTVCRNYGFVINNQ